MKFNKIYIVTDAPIPIGFAPTNRILSYATGFKANGVNCEIIIFRKSGNNTKSNKNKGNYQGVNFQYLFKETNKSKYFLKRRWDNFLGLIRLFFFALKNINKKSVIIYYSSYTRYALLLKLSQVFKKYLLLKEESEHPSVYLNTKNILSKIFFSKFHYQLFDGILVMTEKLKASLQETAIKMPLAIIPMTVDVERFKKSISSNNTEYFITYIGSLNNTKDGILYLVEAFKDFKDESNYSNQCKLRICGYSSNNNEKEELLNMIKKNDLDKDILFEENVSNIEIPNILMNSKVLVLPRPKSKQGENGFPTKLGEYLASSVPVIVSTVGEISKYLTHKTNAYLIEPNNIDSIKEGLEYIINNYEQASNIGDEGQKTALKYFNNIKQTKIIIDFIKEF